MTVSNWVKKNASTILTCIGAGGMIGTVVLAVKATPKAMRLCTDAKVEQRRTQLTRMEIVKAAAPAYIPTAIVGVSTLACFFGANALNYRQQAALMSAYAALDSTFQSYRGKVRDIFGEGADDMVMDAVRKEQEADEDDTPPWDEVQTFYIEGYGKFFERTMQEVMEAEYKINRNFILRGYAPFNEFLLLLGLEGVPNGDDIGWDQYIGEVDYGYRWIDFSHRHYISDEGLLVCSIDMPFEPHRLDECSDDTQVIPS